MNLAWVNIIFMSNEDCFALLKSIKLKDDIRHIQLACK